MATPGGSNTHSKSPNEGAATIKNSPGKAGAGNTAGGSNKRSSSPNAGAATVRGGSRGSRG